MPFVSRQRASTASQPNVRDDRDTPLDFGSGQRQCSPISEKEKDEYFSPQIWTAQISLNRLAKLAFARTRFCGREAAHARRGAENRTGKNRTRFARRARAFAQAKPAGAYWSLWRGA